MSFWTSIRTAASGMMAQRLRLDVISNNIANAQTTRTAEGGPYRRQDVVFQAQQQNNTFQSRLAALRNGQNGNSTMDAASIDTLNSGVKVSAIVTDQTPGQMVYDPTHPDADANGYVTYPNVNPVVEMTNMLSATRSYEANLEVANTAKAMALKALDIGK
jgi:flagellar basal-body rod protein FlgC